MSYRKLRKAYARKFNVYVFLRFSKHEKTDYKLSKKITARVLKRCLYLGKPLLSITGGKIQ